MQHFGGGGLHATGPSLAVTFVNPPLPDCFMEIRKKNTRQSDRLVAKNVNSNYACCSGTPDACRSGAQLLRNG